MIHRAQHSPQKNSFFHPDYTVGFGIAPNQQFPARGLYHRWGLAPRPEECSIVRFYYMQLRVDCQAFL